MGLRRWSIRLRIFLLVAIPILSLIGLYAFTATITASSAINLARSRTVKDTVATPVGNVESALDAERLTAALYLAAPVPQNLAALQVVEHKTDQAVAGLRAASATAAGSESGAEQQAFATMSADVGGLTALRSKVASQSISRPAAIAAYNGIVDQDYAVLVQIILQQDTNVSLATQSLVLARTSKVVDLLLQEDALVLGDTAARSFSAADRQQFAQLAGGRRILYAQILTDFDPVYRAIYNKIINPGVTGGLEALENRVIGAVRAGHIPPVAPAAWSAAVLRYSGGLSAAAGQTANDITASAVPVADSTFLTLFLAGGLGLVAVILSIFASIWIGRGLVRQLAELRSSALDLATRRLPDVVQRLRAGQDVDVSAEAPPLESGSDEIGQVTAAFNAVQQTAVQAAVDEAKLRRGVSDVFRNLARRSQSLLHRQLALLDNMERRASEPEQLEDLFRIDHLTTRMRRHSEGLIILSGETPGRGWRHPVRLIDVLRAAVAEVEDYTRIRVTIATQAALIGPAVADVIHLIAELAENATTFSPPNAPVRVHGDIVGRGFAVEIEDRGLGIAEEKLAQINHDLEHPPQFDLSGSEQLGLFVAGQLARRHDIRITLQPSPYGGITAIVLIPKTLIVDEAEAEAIAASERAIRLTGRHGPLNHGLVEPPALAQLSASASASASADGRPGPAGQLPAGSAGELTSGAAAASSTMPAAQADSVFTPRRPRAAAVTATPADATSTAPPGSIPAVTADGPTITTSPFNLGNGPQGSAAGPAREGGEDPTVSATELTKMGLPVRVRQASLAPQLRDAGRFASSDPADEPAGAPSPEAARSTMTALQRGWERGRYISGAPVPSFDAAQSAEPSADGDEQRNDE
jgi:signal transduction histidine kinase